MKLIITEKRDQVDKIAAAMGWQTKEAGVAEGEFEGDSVYVTCARGHILQIPPPDKIIEGLTWNSVDLMTPIPMDFHKEVIPAGRNNKGKTPKQYFDRIKNASRRANEIIIAADPDREGDLIGWEIVDMLGFSGPIRRLSLSHGMDKAGIQKSFRSIGDSETSHLNATSAEARERGDWAFILVTMAYTFFGRRGAFGPNLCSGDGRASVMSLGRVQTPTLSMIRERCLAIKNFTPITHYTVSAGFSVGDHRVEAAYKPSVTKEIINASPEGVEWQPVDSKTGNALDKPLFVDKSGVERFMANLEAHADEATVKQFKSREKMKNPPPPHDLAALNSEGSKSLGVSGPDIQKAVESLYQKGYVSYPRTEEREIPENIYRDGDAVSILRNIGKTFSDMAAQCHYAGSIHSGQNPDVRAFQPAAFSDKPMSHYAIVPTTQSADVNDMTSLERDVYRLVATRFTTLMYPPARINETTATFIVPVSDMLGHPSSSFSAKAEVVIDPGFMAAFSERKMGGSPLPDMRDGSASPLLDTLLREGKTKPPPHYSDQNIEEAMKTIGRRIKDPEKRKFLNIKEGIGRPSTRMAIIETLIDRQYITRTKKGFEVTALGDDLIGVVPVWVASPETTAVWEGYLEKIAVAPTLERGQKMRDRFVERQYGDISKMIEIMIEENRGKVDMSSASGGASEKQINYARSIATTLGIELPDEAVESQKACSDFIDRYNADYQNQRKPSDNMVNLAVKIAGEKSIDPPDNLRDSYSACRKFIDQNIDNKKKSGAKSKGSGRTRRKAAQSR